MFDNLIGKSYGMDGRGPDCFDCYGLCIEVCSRLDIKLPELDKLPEANFEKVKRPNAGDIVLMQTSYERHVGVMIDFTNLLQVNSMGRRGVHRMRLDHPWIKDRIVGFYRYAR